MESLSEKALNALVNSEAHPKQTPQSHAAAGWYRYYAGYPDSFVSPLVDVLPRDAGPILDPWNGSGTTTSVAVAKGRKTIGIDRNPAALVIAKARLLESDVAGSLAPLSEKIVSQHKPVPLTENDLLLRWMQPSAVAEIRGIIGAIDEHLVGDLEKDPFGGWCGEISSLAALFYLAMFHVVRDELRPFIGTNPTWIRQTVAKRARLRPSRDRLQSKFKSTIRELSSIAASRGVADEFHADYSISLGSSEKLALRKGTVGSVITSPPYCTRIDYVVATMPELGVLGLSSDAVSDLRKGMIGTPVNDGSQLTADLHGAIASEVIRKIESHTSVASNTYYSRFYRQYFEGMQRSLTEMDRVVSKNGIAVLVVQDSFYKDVHVDLPSIVAEFGQAAGWKSCLRRDYAVHTRGNFNKHSRNYRQSVRCVESVLILAR